MWEIGVASQEGLPAARLCRGAQDRSKLGNRLPDKSVLLSQEQRLNSSPLGVKMNSHEHVARSSSFGGVRNGDHQISG